MALKGDREVYIVDIHNTTGTIAEAGQVLVFQPSQPSGHAVGQGINELSPGVVVSGSPGSGTKVAGLTLNGVVDIDQTRVHRNFHNNEQVLGEPTPLLKDGVVWTNKITGTPAGGDIAYLGASGTVSPTQTNSIPAIGKFNTAKDSDGYAKVVIKIA